MDRPRTCPICKKPLPSGQAAKFAPFCGARCRSADLGNWFDGQYAIDAGPDVTETDELEGLEALLNE